MSEQKSFFSTLPGIITAIAGLVTAVAGLIYALSQSGLIGSGGKDETKPAAVASKEPARVPPKQPEAVAPEQSVTPAPKQSVTATPSKPAPAAPNQPVAIAPKRSKEQTTDGWAIIGYYERGRFYDLVLMVRGDSPAIGRRYDAVKKFRLVQKQLEQSKGKAVITLGMVHRGDSVEVLDIEISPGRRRGPVWAKLRAVLHRVERPSK